MSMSYKTIDLSDAGKPMPCDNILHGYYKDIKEKEKNYKKHILNKSNLLVEKINISKKWLINLKEFHEKNTHINTIFIIETLKVR